MQFNSPSTRKLGVRLAAVGALVGAAFAPAAQAADWSDTSMSVRYGSTFAEPFRNSGSEDDGDRLDIKKVIVALTNVTGFKYGTTFINVDFLQSDKNDPGDGINGNPGAQEVYAVFRSTFDLAKITGADFKMFGVVRDLGVTAGFDINTKNDSYASKKRMFVVGPTVMFDVPGFLNLSVLLFDESNAPNGIPARYHYDNHATLEADWGIPIGSLPLSFNGYAQFIGAKGKSEFGGQTSPETHLDADLMLDLSTVLGTGKKSTYVGVEYEYWHNKFGNATKGDSGATASTPMVRAEYHF